MQYGNTGIQHLLDPTFLNKVFKTFPKNNIKKMLFDVSTNKGVYSGLVVSVVPATMTISISPGRAIARDAASGLATTIEVFTAQTIDLTSFLPVSGNSTVLIKVKPNENTAYGAPTSVVNAPGGSEDFIPGFVPYDLYTEHIDESTTANGCVLASLTEDPTDVILCTILLTAGQVSVVSGNINVSTRQDAKLLNTFVDQTLAPTTENNLSLGLAISNLAAQVKAIIGLADWKTPVPTTLEALRVQLDSINVTGLAARVTAVEATFETHRTAINKVGRTMKFVGPLPSGVGGGSNSVSHSAVNVGLAIDFLQGDIVFGAVGGVGIDYVLPGLDTLVPAAGVDTILVSVQCYSYQFREMSIFMGNIPTLTTAPPVLSIGDSFPGTQIGSATLVPVDITSGKTFRLRGSCSGYNSGALVDEQGGFTVTLIGYLEDAPGPI